MKALTVVIKLNVRPRAIEMKRARRNPTRAAVPAMVIKYSNTGGSSVTPCLQVTHVTRLGSTEDGRLAGLWGEGEGQLSPCTRGEILLPHV